MMSPANAADAYVAPTSPRIIATEAANLFISPLADQSTDQAKEYYNNRYSKLHGR
jgi:hypothetical protein